MKTIDLTYILYNPAPQTIFNVKEYETRTHSQVNLTSMTWGGAWSKLLNIALYQKGADVSEIGTSWLGSLIEMEALRPFNNYEVRRLGGPVAFPASSWQTCYLPDDNRIMALPWYLDIPMVLYRRDHLQQAGIDEKEAFGTPEQFIKTLEQLKAIGQEYPIAMPLVNNRVMHNVAAWVWSCGGHIRTPNARRMALREPNALRGIRSYFELHRFVAPRWEDPLEETFFQGQSAIALTSDQVYLAIKADRIPVAPGVKENLCLAMPLSRPYVGGSNLVIWKHTSHDRDALDLISFLTDFDVLEQVFTQLNLLPARLSMLSRLPVASDPAYPVIMETIRAGRGILGYYRWAGIEDRLVNVFSSLWHEIFDDPEIDLDELIPARINEVCDRLDWTTLGTWK